MNLGVTLRNLYEVDCYHDGVLVWSDSFYNLVTTVGKNKLLDACFRTGEAALAWYVGLVNASGFSAYSVTDTMASHAGWTDGVPYSDGTRSPYVSAAASAGSMSNAAARALFNINASQTVQGAFLVDVSTKSGSLGVLYGVGSFVAPRSVISGDVLAVKITLTD
jgi:hypothetical protein